MAFFHSTIRQEGFHPENPDNSHANYFAAPSTSKVDFTDELASLMPLDSHERSSYTRPHNIFDTSSFEYHSQTPDSYARNFNSTLPALNSSIRYDPQPESPYSPTGFPRHTPSPAQAATSRSRSRSRPPSGGNGNSIGPHRTSRPRRTNSISGTSPPPTSYHHYGRPQTIIIPGRNNSNGTGSNAGTPVSPLAGGAWFTNGTGEYMPNEMHHSLHLPSLPHHSHPHQAHAMQYGGFSMSPTDTHLPPVSALHPASLPKGLDGLALTSASSTSPRVSETSPRSSPTTSLQNGAGTTKATPQEKQLLLASEKRRRRRESHNAVERRRRDNINEKISELATLIPECMLEGGSSDAPGPHNMGANGSSQPQTNGEAAALSLDSPTSPTSPLSMNPIPSEEGVDLWGELNGTATDSNGITKKESMDGLGLYPIGEDDSPTPAPGAPNGTATATTTTTTTTTTTGGSAGVKANKGMILRKSVEYIRYLQQLVSAQGARNRELEAELMRHRSSSSSSNGGDHNLTMGVGVGMGGAGMGMGMMWSFPHSASSAAGTTTTGSNGVIDVDDDAGGTSPSAGSGSALTDPDEPPSSKGVKQEDAGEGEDGKDVRGRKRGTKFTNGVSSSPTNRTLRTRARNGKAATANGYVNGDGDEDMGSDVEDRMEI